MWIDMMVAFEPGHRLTAVKNVSLAEDHLHDHFADQPIMPASLMLEGMAQTAGVLVGSMRGFKEKVILAKIGSATIDADVIPGQTIR
jgi:3-hydroxyacyl-[acyl-carrier-protein] dehydratase